MRHYRTKPLKWILFVTVFFFGMTSSLQSFSQRLGYCLDFNNNNWKSSWSNSDYSVTNTNGVLTISGTNIGYKYQNIVANLPTLDMSLVPNVYIKIKSQNSVKFQLRLIDSGGNETNDNNPVAEVSGITNFKWVTLNYSGKFNQNYPNRASVDASSISQMSILINAGGNPNYTGWIEIDKIIFGDSTQIDNSVGPNVNQPKVNQIGYLTHASKRAVIPSRCNIDFFVINAINNDTVFKGISSDSKKWQYSDEDVVIADFSKVVAEGKYYLASPGLIDSYQFSISDTIFNKLLYDATRTFYYQRASIEIKPEYGGIWHRSMGHPDNVVYVHPSAATTSRPANSKISCPKGWYDAGDYNKYVAPACLTLWQLLESYEITKKEFAKLNIDAENKNIPDIINEVVWELDWLISMQDLDGGVYHKLTNPDFDSMVMPNDATNTRYVVQKTTSASLDFAAILAKSARIFQTIDGINQVYIDKLIVNAEKAWAWAKINPNVNFDQNKLNTQFLPAIHTGDYGVQSGNLSFADEKFWAATELYLLTRKIEYLAEIKPSKMSECIPSWESLQFPGIADIVESKSIFPTDIALAASEYLFHLADKLLNEYNNSAYGLAMGQDPGNFSWNSNMIACNQSVILLEAYKSNNNHRYLDAATANLNYVLGMNPLDICFVTGHGSKSPRFIHHRISAADGIPEPIPGFLVNGPHNHYLSECSYPSTLPAFSYVDELCSSATNEVAIYVNSSLIHTLSLLKSVNLSSPVFTHTTRDSSTGTVFPNPTKDFIFISDHKNDNWEFYNQQGILLLQGNNQRIDISRYPSGIYFLKRERITTKIIKSSD